MKHAPALSERGRQDAVSNHVSSSRVLIGGVNVSTLNNGAVGHVTASAAGG